MTDKLKVLIDRDLLEELILQHISKHGFTNKAARQAQIVLNDPAVEAAEIEVVAREIYESWWAVEGYVPWVVGGNSLRQGNARKLARQISRRILAGVNQQAGSGVPDIAPGVKLCVAYLENRAREYANDHGSYDDDTGSTEFRNPQQEDYYNDLHELADSFRAMLKAAPLPPSPAAKAVQS